MWLSVRLVSIDVLEIKCRHADFLGIGCDKYVNLFYRIVRSGEYSETISII
jgi:hypothetical protein